MQFIILISYLVTFGFINVSR